MGITILVADGNEQIRNDLKLLFTNEGYEVDSVGDGITVIKYLRRYDYQLAVLDTHLPELDGKSVSRQLRKITALPFIFLSDHSEEEDILEGYALGAEDYIIKPFSGKELLARVKVILRRNPEQGKSLSRNLVFTGLQIDTVSHTVYVNEQRVTLTPKEYELLILLAKNPERAFSREMLLNQIWGNDYYGTDRTVDTHIKTLREALKPYHGYISTVRGFGYKFSE